MYLSDVAKTDEEFIDACLKRYPELSWLVGDCNTTPEGNATLSGKSWGARFFPQKEEADIAELNRTILGLLVMRWVMTDQYDALVACQPEQSRLSPSQFEDMKAYVKEILSTKEEEETMIVFMIINDLGKIKSIAKQLNMEEQVDHDVILAHGLTNNPSLSPSFSKLSTRHREMILLGLNTLFNMSQFMQAENVPASLVALKQLPKEPLDFYLLHAFFDIAGAAGHVKWNGSTVMSKDTYTNFMLAVHSLREPGDVKEVYWSYVDQRMSTIHVFNGPQFAISRLCCMLRISKEGVLWEDLKDAWLMLQPMETSILIRELGKCHERPADILLYYSPAFLVNAHGIHGKKGLHVALRWMSRIYQETRIAMAKKTAIVDHGICTILVSDLAQAAKGIGFCTLFNFQRVVMAGNKATLELVPQINLGAFSTLMHLDWLQGEVIVPIGIGGGSDVIQAGHLAMMLRAEGKTCPCVISIRTVGRSVSNHGGEIAPNVFRITSETTGSGRFLESLPVQDIPVFLILADLSNPSSIVTQIQSVLDSLDLSVNTLMAVDTGGDALDIHDITSQDAIVLGALRSFESKYHCFLCDIAVGVDAPPNAEEVLQKAKAAYFNPPPSNEVKSYYEKWHMIGPDAKSFGKTPLAWVQALENNNACQTEIPLPLEVVNDFANPWSPFVHIQPCMREMFFMSLKNLFL